MSYSMRQIYGMLALIFAFVGGMAIIFTYINFESIKQANQAQSVPQDAYRQITIPLSTPWMNTDVQVTSGARLLITATGKGVWKNIRQDSPKAYPEAFEECGPDGTPPQDSKDYYSNISQYQSQDAYKGALLGKIGEHGKSFKVGSNFNQAINESGTLYLGINDIRPEVDRSSWTDNSGSFIATVHTEIDTRQEAGLPRNSDGSYKFPANYEGWYPIGEGNFTIEVKGSINFGGAVASPDRSPIMGNNDALVPGEPFGVLVGKIGERGQPFAVGYSHTFVTNGQTAYIAVNDSYYGDNTGSYIIYKR
jgi:hypothetical protein